MDEVTKQFYEDVERFAPRNHKNEIDWKTLLGSNYDAAISGKYYVPKSKETLPSIRTIALFTYLFSKEQLEQFAFHKLKTSKKLQQKDITEYEKLFGKSYTGRRQRKRIQKEDLQLSLEERELEIKRKRSPLEKKLRKEALIAHVWVMSAKGLID